MSQQKRIKAENRINEIYRKSGEITPEMVIEDAKKTNSPLHNYFEWDDSKAAREYRLQQARELIRSVTIISTIQSHKIVAPRYVRDSTKESSEQGYTDIQEAIPDKEMAVAILKTEVDRIERLIMRAQAIALTIGLKKYFDDAMEHLLSLKEKLKVA